MNRTATALANLSTLEDDRYPEALAGIQDHFDAVIAKSPLLFTTNATGLWEAYLASAPPETRQSRNCNCCRSFIEKFGGLVTISESGEIESAVWPKHAPPQYADAAHILRRVVGFSHVTGVFRAKEKTWGTPVTGPWSHMAIVPPKSILSTSRLETPHQEMAAKLEEFRMLQRSLQEFPIHFVQTAHAYLTNGSLYRSEKCEGVAKWLLDLHEKLEEQKHGASRIRNNLVWRAVAKAPPGYCHVRSGMIGTLLEDIAAGLPFEDIKRKWADKMDPTQYMRPTAPPSAGNIAQAEKIVGTLRSEGALARRFAKLTDVEKLWSPRASTHLQGRQVGMTSTTFGHLKPRELVATPILSNAPATILTWSKFASTVLPHAEQIEYLVPSDRKAYTAHVTAVNPDAPNILQWDNPVSHYVYSDGSYPGHWNLTAGQYHKVTAVVLRPWMWSNPERFAHFGEGVCFVLDGCRDTGHVRSGGMFPEQMKSEYHSVRKTLEAHFSTAPIIGLREAEVCGVSLVNGSPFWGLTFRVTARGVRTLYKLDRWD